MAPMGIFSLAISGVVVSLVLSGCGQKEDTIVPLCKSTMEGNLGQNDTDTVNKQCNEANSTVAVKTCTKEAMDKVKKMYEKRVTNFTTTCAIAVRFDPNVSKLEGAVKGEAEKALALNFYRNSVLETYQRMVEADVEQAIKEINSEKSKDEKEEGKEETEKAITDTTDAPEEEKKEDGVEPKVERLYDSGIQSVSLVGINSVVFAFVIAGMLAGTVGLIAVRRRSSHQLFDSLVDSEESDSANA